MKKFIRRLAVVSGGDVGVVAALAVWAPAIGSAQPLDCGNGLVVGSGAANVCWPPL